MDFEQYQAELIRAAKRIQGEDFVGDEYYRDPCWREYFSEGQSPRDAVLEDMSYWEPAEV